MKDREKEIEHLLYLKAELIKKTKKEVKELHRELDDIRGEKRLVRDKHNRWQR